MTDRSDFTDAEWDLLTRMPTMAAFGAMAADNGDPVTSMRELWAGMQELAQSAGDTYRRSSLVQNVACAITHREDGSELTLEDWRASGPEALPRAVVETTLETAAKVRQILARGATPDTTAEYLAWVMGVAQAGVRAAKSGPFGLSGTEVTPREAEFLSELSAALGSEG